MAALTTEQMDALRTYATPAALNYHDTVLPKAERLNFAATLAVYGDMRLVAADVLETVCRAARGTDGSGDGKLKRFRVEGDYEEEYFAGVSTEVVNANAWCDRAALLRGQVSNPAGLIPSPLAVMVAGNNPEPVFRINRCPGGRDPRETP